MRVYTYSEARQKLAALLEEASAGGEVRIRRKDGREFTVRLAERSGSALDVSGVNVPLSIQDVVGAVREGRER